MNGTTLPTVALSATSEATREPANATSSGLIDSTSIERTVSAEAKPTTLSVEPRKRRAFIEPDRIAQSRGNDEQEERGQPRTPWFIRNVLPHGGALLILADCIRTARKCTALFSEVCAMHTSTPALQADQVASQLLASTFRENAIDAEFRVTRTALPMVLNKCYTMRNGAHMPLSTYGLAERFHSDLGAMIASANNEDAARDGSLCIAQTPHAELVRDPDGVADFIRDFTSIRPGSGVILNVVGAIDTTRLPVALFDGIFMAKEYWDEDEPDGMVIELHESRYLSPREFPNVVMGKAPDGIWSTRPFLARDPDIRDMAERAIKGEKLEAIGASYGIGKGQVSKLLKPLRVRGLLKSPR